MTNALYKVTPGQTSPPLASDQTQFVDFLNANIDIGPVAFAGALSAPSNAGITAAAAAGSALGTGVYYYNFTYVTGIIKSDNTTVISGETLPSTSISVTTTAGSQAVTISGMPTVNNWPATAIGFRIYRTVVGGADGTQKLVTTFYTNYARSTSQTSYTDTTADGSLGAAVPTVNTTGTYIGGLFKSAKNTLDDGTGASTHAGLITANAGITVPSGQNISYQGNILPQLRLYNNKLQFYNGTVWKYVAGYGSGQYSGSFSTMSVTSVTALSVTGTGSLKVVKVAPAASISMNITIIIDGVTIINNLSYSGTTTGVQYLSPLGDINYGGGSTTYADPIPFDVSFESSMQININSGGNGSNTSSVYWLYELV